MLLRVRPGVLLLVFITLWLMPDWLQLVFAHQYASREDSARWIVEPSSLACVLKHPVPAYGEAVFLQQAGESLQFYLQSAKELPHSERVVFRSEAPPWRHSVEHEYLGIVKGGQGREPVRVGYNMANRILAELQSGRFPVVDHSGWYTGQRVEVAISPVNFTEAFETYQDCLASLLPVSFKHLAHSTLLFDNNRSEIKPEFKRQLRQVAQYMASDPAVIKVRVDGYADSIGRKGANWSLSRRRAEVVKQFLISAGVDAKKIVVHYHGDQILVIKNPKNKSEREKNRRVTVFLERGAS